MTTILAVLCGLGCAVGVALLAAAVFPQFVPHVAVSRGTVDAAIPAWLRNRTRARRGALACVAGLVGWWVTGWPVAALALIAAVLGLPSILAPAAPRRNIELCESLASWIRRVADLLASGSGGLEHALARSAATAPPRLRTPVERLVEHHRRDGWEAALRQFATDLADPTADEVALVLLLRTRAGGRGLAECLHSHAEALTTEATARRAVEADRATPRTTVRCLVGITATMIAGLVSFARDYLAPFDTPGGQGVLALAVLVMAAALTWMHRLATPRSRRRYLTPAGGTP